MCGRKEAGQAEDETAPRKSKVFNMEEATGRRTGPQTQNDSLSKHPLLGPLCVVCIQDRCLASEREGALVFGLSVCEGIV